jgi:hypothetical protein
MEITIQPRTIFRWLTLIIVLLTLAHLAGVISTFYLGHDYIYGLIPSFNMNLERNVPTLFSSGILLLSAALLLFIGYLLRGKAYFLHWLGLGVIFFYLSLDELISIHEKASKPLRNQFDLSGIFHFSWIILYGILLVIFAVAYFRFVRSLPTSTRNIFILAGIIYVGGALGLELVAGELFTQFGNKNVTFALFVAVEEALEMFGIAIFIYGLLGHLQSSFGSVRLNFSSPTPASGISDSSSTS